MRSVSAASSNPRTRGRTTANRRSAPVRGASDRPVFGKRKKFRTDPISRLFRATAHALNPRRPAFIVTMLAALVAAIVLLFAGGYVHRAMASVNGGLSVIAADAGFEISAIQFTGNRYTQPSEISDKLQFKPGDSIFAADPQEARQRLQELPWVRDADISVRYPDTVFVHLTEKVPFALWQSAQGLYAVDRSGHPITQVDAAKFKHLPLFFGDAPAGASDLVEAIGAHRAVASRVKAMQRVSNRRWNLILDDGVLVKLPEEGWAKELGTLERLIVDNGVLERDIAEIDLRSHDNYFFTLRHPAPSRKTSRGEPT
jgi:cell division protein FtsQ